MNEIEEYDRINTIVLETREKLKELGIESPDLSKGYKIKLDSDTTFFFNTKVKYDRFKQKYYDTKNGTYVFETEKINEYRRNGLGDFSVEHCAVLSE